MQKKIIALAVAGLVSGAAFAQSNVTIYGVADVGVSWENSKSGAGSQFRVQSGQSAGSRLGFKGEEALGNGLKALWTLEMGLDIANGESTCHSTNTLACANTTTNNGAPAGANVHGTTNNQSIFQRQAFAGLSSATLGTATFGRQYTPGFAVKAKADAFGMGTAATLNNTGALLAGVGVDRLDNSVAYTTPTWSGFSGQLVYSSGIENNVNGFVSDTTTEKAGKAWAGLLSYQGYGFDLGLAYHDVYGTTGSNATVSGITYAGTTTQAAKSRGYLLGGNYDFKVAKVFASYGSAKTTQDGATSTTDGDTKAKGNQYSIGVKVPFGAHSIAAQYSRYNDKLSVDRDFTVYGVGYEYAMSKRTALYAAYAHGTNKNQGTSRLNSATNTGLSPTASNDPNALQVGLRHSF